MDSICSCCHRPKPEADFVGDCGSRLKTCAGCRQRKADYKRQAAKRAPREAIRCPKCGRLKPSREFDSLARHAASCLTCKDCRMSLGMTSANGRHARPMPVPSYPYPLPITPQYCPMEAPCL